MAGARLGMLSSIIGGVVAAVFLQIFYASVQHRWPENYYSLQSSMDPVISRHLSVYLSFRSVPVYLASVFLTVSMYRIGGNSAAALSVMALLHLALTNIGAMTRQFARKFRAQPSSGSLVVFHALASIVVILSAALGATTSPVWRNLIPSPPEIGVALWTALFAAVLAVYAQRATLRVVDLDELVRRARRDVGNQLLEEARHIAITKNADPILVESILLAECLQRPKWVRRLEYLKSKLVPEGTYGVMQVSSQRPIDDRQSIERGVEEYRDFHVPRSSSGFVSPGRLEHAIERHNSDARFVDLVQQIFRRLEPHAIAKTSAVAQDGRPVIEVLNIARRGDYWTLHGTASVYEGNLLCRYQLAGQTEVVSVQAEMGAPNRGEWKALIPLEVLSVTIEEPSMEESVVDPMARSVTVDLQWS